MLLILNRITESNRCRRALRFSGKTGTSGDHPHRIRWVLDLHPVRLIARQVGAVLPFRPRCLPCRAGRVLGTSRRRGPSMWRTHSNREPLRSMIWCRNPLALDQWQIAEIALVALDGSGWSRDAACIRLLAVQCFVPAKPHLREQTREGDRVNMSSAAGPLRS